MERITKVRCRGGKEYIFKSTLGKSNYHCSTCHEKIYGDFAIFISARSTIDIVHKNCRLERTKKYYQCTMCYRLTMMVFNGNHYSPMYGEKDICENCYMWKATYCQNFQKVLSEVKKRND